MTHLEKWAGAAALRPLLAPVAALRTDDRNARRHDDRSVAAIATSLRSFGQLKPVVVDGAGVVVAGNGTLEAARREGWTHLAVVAADALTADQLRAFAIADNRTAELSEWDFESLATTLKGLPGDLLPVVGFSDFELAPLLRASWEPDKVEDLPTSSPTKKTHVVTFDDAQWALVQAALGRLDTKPASVPEGIAVCLKRFLL